MVTRSGSGKRGVRGRLVRLGLALIMGVTIVGLSASAADAATSADTTQFSVTAGTLSFSTVPSLATAGLAGVTLNGSAQTTHSSSALGNFAGNDATGTGSGWNVTVNGTTTTGSTASQVFKTYCAGAGCPDSTANGAYDIGALTSSLPANSLTLVSTGATWTPSSTAPTYQCSSACNVDAAPGSPVKIISAATNTGMGTYTTGGWATSSLTLNTPSSLAVPGTNEVYRINLTWSLTSGP
jgi:hypothetical protein